MLQLICHLIGDFCLQNDYIAERKTRNTAVCLMHVLLYSVPFFALIGPSWPAMAVIVGTHFLIDRFSLTRLWVNGFKIGVEKDYPIRFWLYVIVDNTIHLTINYVALSHRFEEFVSKFL